MSSAALTKPAEERVTRTYIDLPIFFPESEEVAKSTYLLAGPRAAFAKLYDRAVRGSANSQAVLANCFLNGWVDGKCLPNEAKVWAKKSAAQGNAYGQWILAWACLELDDIGDGLAAMFDSADQGFAPALYHLGLFHILGVGVQTAEGAGIQMLGAAAGAGHELSIRTIEHYARIGKFGSLAVLKSLVVTPLVRPLRYLKWILFKRKFSADQLSYVRSLIIQNSIRRRYSGEFIAIEPESRLAEMIRKAKK